MKIFLDTSSLVKLYHSETGTIELDQIFAENAIHEIFLAEITKIEFASAIWKKVRTKDLTPDEAADLMSSFENDYEKFSFIAMSSKLVVLARDLVAKYGLKGLRTLDSIQLASVLNVKSDLSSAITADDLLKSLFTIEGLKTR
ncbi:MAG: PIN domain-containing protein [Candidatus Moranbacteria bacterium]|nr:PIN domain-containing protein [Candidatus Moranbacteria bacterium]